MSESEAAPLVALRSATGIALIAATVLASMGAAARLRLAGARPGRDTVMRRGHQSPEEP